MRKSESSRSAVGDGPALHAGEQPPQIVVVVAGDDHSVERHRVHELQEGLLHVVHVAIAIHVLAIDVGHHREDRRELQERAVALVGLGHQVLRLAQPRVGAHRIDAAADDHRGIESAGGQHRRNHRRGRGLAVHAGDGDAVFQAHQLGQHLGALDHRNVLLVRGDDFGIVAMDGRADDDDFRAGDVLGAMAFGDG